MGCWALNDIAFAEGITCIPQYLFAGCTGLQDGVVIPDTVETIKQYAFFGCRE
ncbi:MAG: leucine-rich repeat protein, partial [Clostridia bacterium]|nr:leucine-rich repeat protein [Clostridia bacterium]